MKTEFRPWYPQLRGGILMAAGGGALAYFGRDINGWLVVAGAFVILCGIALISKGRVRQAGQRIERAALRNLQLPPEWSHECNVPVAGCGDLDLMIETPVGRMAVEIKSHTGVMIRRNPFGQERLVRLNGHALWPDPVLQVQKLAEKTRGTPVLWFPAARRPKIMTLRAEPSHIHIVQGPPRMLVRAIYSIGS